MKNIKIINNKNETKLICKLNAGQKPDRNQIEFINLGKVKNMIRINLIRKRNTYMLVYDLMGMITLSEFLGLMTVSRKLLAGLLRQLINFLKMVETNPVNAEKICFDIDKVMIFPAGQKLMFVYIPVTPCESCGKVITLLQSILEQAVFSPYEDSSYVNRFIDIINEGDNLSMHELERYVESISDIKRLTLSAVVPEKRRCFKCNALIRRGDIYCSLCGDKLNNEQGVPYVLRRKNQEKIYIERLPFLFGKTEGDDRYFITDNPLISRIHAKIYSENGHYYICDLGSTNGTYINGLRIPENEKYELNYGTVFCLVTEEFTFYL